MTPLADHDVLQNRERQFELIVAWDTPTTAFIACQIIYLPASPIIYSIGDAV